MQRLGATSPCMVSTTRLMAARGTTCTCIEVLQVWLCRIHSWTYKEHGLPITVDGPLEASPYNPQPADTQAKSYITCTGIEDAADGIKTFYFGSPRDSSGRSARVRYTPGQYASFDIQVYPAGFIACLASTQPCRMCSGTLLYWLLAILCLFPASFSATGYCIAIPT